MRLYLIRHAESANNVLYGMADEATRRSPDPDITERGHQQAALLAAHLAHPDSEPRQHAYKETEGLHFGLTHLYCSLMSRTILTGSYVAEATKLPLVALPDLFEKGGIYKVDENGRYHGLPGPNRAYFEQRFPALNLPESLGDEGWYNRPPESEATFLVRMKKVVGDIKERHLGTAHRVALIVHGDFIDQFINELLGMERHPANYADNWVANWATHNTSISRIDLEQSGRSIVYLNRINHLPAHLVSW